MLTVTKKGHKILEDTDKHVFSFKKESTAYLVWLLVEQQQYAHKSMKYMENLISEK